MAELTIVGIAGSLRKGSFNQALLDTAADIGPDYGLAIETFDIAPIPFYDRDLEEDGDPDAVAELKRRIGEADGVLIATPEYCHSIPGVLKNTLDWLSRPPGESVLQDKPVTMMGASPSPVGTARAHLDLRKVLQYTKSDIVAKPEVLVSSAPDKFEDGRLISETSLGFMRDLLEVFADHIRGRE